MAVATEDIPIGALGLSLVRVRPQSESTLFCHLPPSTTAVPLPSKLQMLSPPRRIRFAPLPDPRRAVFIADDGTEHPIPQLDLLFAPDDALAASTSSLSMPLDESRDGLPYATPYTIPASLPAAVSLALSPETKSGPGLLQALAPGNRPKSMLTGYTYAYSNGDSSSNDSNSSSNTSSRNNLDVESASSLISEHNSPTPKTSNGAPATPNKGSGLLSLFRTSSRSSQAPTPTATAYRFLDNDPVAGKPLQRWTSATSADSSSSSLKKGSGVPMFRTQSTPHSGSNLKKSIFSRSKSKSQKSSSSGATAPTGAHKAGLISTIAPSTPTSPTSAARKAGGVKMLNGRVYGARRPAPNPNVFANTREEPEFIEWGYGGMGSVNNANVGGSVWGKVMSGDGNVFSTFILSLQSTTPF
jgi:hypothetical protein